MQVPTTTGVVVSQVNWLASLVGYVQTSNNPTGGSFAVNSYGEIAVADTDNIYLINAQTGVVTPVGAWSGASAVAIDSKNNIYVGNLYGTPDIILKIPYVGGSANDGYAAFTTPTTSTAACTTSSTTECSVPHVGTFYPDAMAFDSAGDLFWITSTTGLSGGNGIWECTVACLGGTGNPVEIYLEPTATTPPAHCRRPGHRSQWECVLHGFLHLCKYVHLRVYKFLFRSRRAANQHGRGLRREDDRLRRVADRSLHDNSRHSHHI